MLQLIENYGLDRFVSMEWHYTGSFANPDAIARGTYYGVAGSPTVFFDGTDKVVGADMDMYSTYEPIFLAHEAALAPVGLEADLTVEPGALEGTVRVTATIAPGESIANSGDVYLGVAVYLRNWDRAGTIWHDQALRLPIYETTSIANGGESDTKIATFSLDPATINANYVSFPWDWCEVRAVGFLQREGAPDNVILNSTLALDTFHVSVADLDHPVRTSSGEPVAVGTAVTCDGALGDDVTVTIDKSGLPAGWDAELEWSSTTYPTTLTIPDMLPGEVENVIVRTIPGGDGHGSVVVSTSVDSYPLCPAVKTYDTFVNTPSILFVDDDNGFAFEPLFHDAITNAGKYFLSFEADQTTYPDASYLSGFDVVIWTTGELAIRTIGGAPRAELEAYLDGGGALFLTSQGILNQQGIGNPLMGTYMDVASFTLDTPVASASGVTGDPIGDGIAYPNTPPSGFADNSDEITPGAGAVAWLTRDGSGNPVGIRHDAGTYRTVYMSAAFEGVPAGTADVLMGRIIDWLAPQYSVDAGTVAASVPGTLSLAQNSPNPFRGSTLVRFAVPDGGPVDVSVFDVTGRLVRRLVSGDLAAGPHSVAWDGSDSRGDRVASGVYLYRVQAGRETRTREMIHLR